MNMLKQIHPHSGLKNDQDGDDAPAHGDQSARNTQSAHVAHGAHGARSAAAAVALARSQALSDAAELRRFADTSSASHRIGLAPGAVAEHSTASASTSTSAATATVTSTFPSSSTSTSAPTSTLAAAAGPRSQALSTAVLQAGFERLERQGHLVQPSSRSRLTEEFRHLKRPLLDHLRHPDAAANRSALIMVTSALPREGKTLFSINLALSLAAEMDTSVLLVDADVVQPELMRRLGLPNRMGMLDLLMRPDLNLSDVVLPTHLPKLSLLPSGTPHDLSSELLGSQAMANLLAPLADRGPGRIVIFDAPPLLATNEAQVLASRVGQVVVVVEASKSPISAVAEAFAMLHACPVVMAVLNKAKASTLSGGYGAYGHRGV